MENTGIMGSDGLWLFAIIALLNGGFGGWGGRGYGYGERCATVEDINNSANFTRLESQVRDNANLTERKADAITAGLCDGFYATAQQINNVNQNVMESRYLTEKTVTDSSAQVLAAINGLSAKMDAEKMAEMREKITRLENEKLFCGIPRINPFAYGVYPYAGCGCTGQNYNI